MNKDEIPEEILEQADRYIDSLDLADKAKAVSLLKPYASSDNSEVHRILGIVYDEWNDIKGAMRHLLFAAEQGNGKAQAYMIEVCLLGEDGFLKPDYKEAAKWIKIFKQQNCMLSTRRIMYKRFFTWNTERVIARLEEALAAEEESVRGMAAYYLWLIHVSDPDLDQSEKIPVYQETALACKEEFMLCYLARCYSSGSMGYERNLDLGLHMIRMAEERGFDKATIQAELQFIIDESMKLGAAAYRRKNYEDSMIHYCRAKNAGSLEAGVWIGIHCLYGLGVETDYNEALAWFTPAAEQGSLLASEVLGEMYYNGNGVAKNIEKAIILFSVASASEDRKVRREAEYYLGKIFLTEEPYKDVKKARDLLLKAAEQNSAKAMHTLGEYYEGVYGDYETNMSEAMSWYGNTLLLPEDETNPPED